MLTNDNKKNIAIIVTSKLITNKKERIKLKQRFL